MLRCRGTAGDLPREEPAWFNAAFSAEHLRQSTFIGAHALRSLHSISFGRVSYSHTASSERQAQSRSASYAASLRGRTYQPSEIRLSDNVSARPGRHSRARKRVYSPSRQGFYSETGSGRLRPVFGQAQPVQINLVQRQNVFGVVAEVKHDRNHCASHRDRDRVARVSVG